MKKWLFSTGLKIFLIAIGALVFLGGCSSQPTAQMSRDIKADGKLKVVATFYPLAEFARQVGGAKVEVVTIIPAGSEPHDFEPTPRDIAGINSASVFIYNGSPLDPWAEKVAADLPPSTLSIGMAKALGIDSSDPHFWLDPVLAAKEVEAIRDAFSAADPARSGDYAANANLYLSKLKTLDADFAAGLSSCAQHEIFTSHEAFAYLARRYGLSQVPITGISPDAEPSARALADLATLARAKGIKYIFFETLASPKLAQTLASEIGAQTLVLNPLEGLTAEETKSGMDYISVMRQNLANLKIALQCP